MLLLRTPLPEKILKHGRALLSQHAAKHLGLVIELCIYKQVDHRARSTRLGICCTKYKAGQTGMQDRTAAHGAGLQRHIQVTTVKAIVAQNFRCSPQGDYFCMSRRVVIAYRCVASCCYDRPVLNHDGTNRNLAGNASFSSVRKCDFHELDVIHGIHHLSSGTARGCCNALSTAIPTCFGSC